MSGLVLPSFALEKTRQCVTHCLMTVPKLTRFLDTPGLLAAVCLDAQEYSEAEQTERLTRAANTSHGKLAMEHGLPNLRILRRLAGNVLSDKRLALLRTVCCDRSGLRILWHARYISAPLIDALAIGEVRRQVTSGFLCELGRMRAELLPYSRDVVTMGRFLHEYLPNTKIHSKKHYERLFDEHHSRLVDYLYACRHQLTFPDPPWTDEPGYAVALRTPRELIAESLAMRNCVGCLARFARQIKRNKAYFFHVEGNWGMPEATLYCVKNGDHWRIEEARSWGNQPLASRYVYCLAVWLAEKQGIADESRCMPNSQAPKAVGV